jgi:hypothetical protein
MLYSRVRLDIYQDFNLDCNLGRHREILNCFDAADTKKATEFATSPNLKDVMTTAEVIDVPTMYVLESI